jgi:outer membrane receptor protein involved in Fe transport
MSAYAGQQRGDRVAVLDHHPVDPAHLTALGGDPDPAGGADKVLYGRGYTKAVASMSYTIRLKESNRQIMPKTITLDLNIDNLLDWKPEIYGSINDIVQTGNTFFRPRVGEDITSPARRTVPGAFGYLAPRTYTFSARMNF